MTNNDTIGQVEDSGEPRLSTVKPREGCGKSPFSPLLLTEAQAADVLSLSARKVWELAARGAIPCIKIGAVKRYRPTDLQKWVNDGCPDTDVGIT